MLRRAGKSRREIKELLAIGSNATLNDALSGEPPQPWARRPNAKDELREAARELRRRGLDYNRIAAGSACPRARSRSGCATSPARPG